MVPETHEPHVQHPLDFLEAISELPHFYSKGGFRLIHFIDVETEAWGCHRDKLHPQILETDSQPGLLARASEGL